MPSQISEIPVRIVNAPLVELDGRVMGLKNLSFCLRHGYVAPFVNMISSLYLYIYLLFQGDSSPLNLG